MINNYEFQEGMEVYIKGRLLSGVEGHRSKESKSQSNSLLKTQSQFKPNSTKSQKQSNTSNTKVT